MRLPMHKPDDWLRALMVLTDLRVADVETNMQLGSDSGSDSEGDGHGDDSDDDGGGAAAAAAPVAARPATGIVRKAVAMRRPATASRGGCSSDESDSDSDSESDSDDRDAGVRKGTPQRRAGPAAPRRGSKKKKETKGS